MKCCSVEGCGKPVKAKGFCSAHYKRLWRHGSALGGGSSKAPNGATRTFLEALIGYQGDDCVKWPYATLSDGRGVVKFDGRTHYASRAMCTLAHGEPPDPSMEAAHSCGKGHLGCVNPRHLRWATRSENANDKLIHGTHIQGSKHGMSKLTEDMIPQIREAIALGFTQQEIADELGVSNPVISMINTGKIWAHVP